MASRRLVASPREVLSFSLDFLASTWNLGLGRRNMLYKQLLLSKSERNQKVRDLNGGESKRSKQGISTYWEYLSSSSNAIN
jgi:hypothetical protein